ncbi:MAG TPA: hypothetical protein VN698_15330 [Bacteroidia bacterium]|nr:hypothetical protein [Bacteroidia bacterium]
MIIRKKKLITTIQSAFLILIYANCIKTHAQQNVKLDTTLCRSNYVSKLEIGADYLVPTRYSNQIQTVSLHGFFWKKHFKKLSAMISVGLTSTYAWGHSSQWKYIFNTPLEEISYKTSAFGIGPVIQTDPTIIATKRFSLIVEASGGFILYTNRFPYGGAIYNFMFRTGPSITYKIGNNYSFKAGYRWMHVSNGQGSGNQNPFYEAQGINISFIKRI